MRADRSRRSHGRNGSITGEMHFLWLRPAGAARPDSPMPGMRNGQRAFRAWPSQAVASRMGPSGRSRDLSGPGIDAGISAPVGDQRPRRDGPLEWSAPIFGRCQGGGTGAGGAWRDYRYDQLLGCPRKPAVLSDPGGSRRKQARRSDSLRGLRLCSGDSRLRAPGIQTRYGDCRCMRAASSVS